MNRREFLATGVGGALGHSVPWRPAYPSWSQQGGVRQLFPRLEHEIFLNAAAGTPLARFAAAGLERYQDFWQLGPSEGRGEYAAEVLSEIRGLFASFIGARASEIGLVHCTKAGEQIVLDSLPALREGGNVVTNDMHFTGSLHNLVGLKRAGMDVRIVRGSAWDVPLEAMEAAIDHRTALVAVTLVSNINGRIEPVRELSEIAHARGAYVYADVIQAAGIVPFDVRELGVDFAACSGYKWLFGPHGVGFFYVAEEHQGTALPDHLFPGHVAHNYPPWVREIDANHDEFVYRSPTDARRYQPGHVSYLGYAALYEGLKFIDGIGIDIMQRHAVRLSRRLERALDADKYRCISPHLDRCPIATFVTRNTRALEPRLRAAGLVVTLNGNRLRVSPAIYNTDDDIDRLVAVLNAA